MKRKRYAWRLALCNIRDYFNGGSYPMGQVKLLDWPNTPFADVPTEAVLLCSCGCQRRVDDLSGKITRTVDNMMVTFALQRCVRDYMSERAGWR